MGSVQLIAKDMLSFPTWGRGVFSVFRRNYLYFKTYLVSSLVGVAIEPLFYLGGVGFGLGLIIPEVNGQSYPVFFLPAIISIAGAYLSFSESAHGSYQKRLGSDVYSCMQLTPLSGSEIALGEILWAAFKGVCSSTFIGLVGLALGLITFSKLVPLICVCVLSCWLFGAIGLLVSTLIKNQINLLYFQSLFMLPQALLAGTYFPLDKLDQVLQWMLHGLPLTHSVSASRIIVSAEPKSTLFANLAFLLLLASLATNVASSRLSRKISE